MSKIALCLFGHLRTFKDCWESLNNNLIIPNNIKDIFLMTWMDSIGLFQHPENSTDHKSHIGYNKDSPPVDINEFTAILNMLKPRKVHLDNYFLHDARFENMIDELSTWNHPSIHHRPKGTLSQVWGRCASLKLKETYEITNNCMYDGVVCTRWDIFYNQVIDLNKFNLGYITHDGMFGSEVISDAWIYGDTKSMNELGTQFRRIPNLVNTKTMNLGPHEWLKAHLNYSQVQWLNGSDLINITIKR